jgi:N6-adenosine-specific RNA methylase IME4
MSDPFFGLPRRRFKVIYADPPWRFETYSDKGKGKSAERHYSCMSIDDIKRLPVRELAAEDAVLFMWVTWPHLLNASAVMAAWGFTYRTAGFVWVKQNPSGEGLATGTGFWTRANSEPCLLGANGRCCRVANNIHQIVMSPRREHSRKPDEVANRIVQLMGDVPRIELFAREARPGWTLWGNEAPVSDADVQGAIQAPAPSDEVIERLVGTGSPRVIVLTYANGTRAWRYAAEKTLRYEGADEMLAAVQQQIKEARELDAILPPMGASTSSTT